ncbi:hypothetical protein M5D96_006716 [Drosophila gunungcola]|uniref:Uncharacterized protein n=1 Tax=Drosophila gunungcola TaxID=103775 RepID=A0A9P9YPI7_9MUSC|nr:hypothetical protein M5D96_006716 [Drosophila gunungcola]
MGWKLGPVNDNGFLEETSARRSESHHPGKTSTTTCALPFRVSSPRHFHTKPHPHRPLTQLHH